MCGLPDSISTWPASSARPFVGMHSRIRRCPKSRYGSPFLVPRSPADDAIAPMIDETPQANSTVAEKLRSEISEIEHAIDSGAYRPGLWTRLLTRARATSGADRLAISADATRVSRKLHRPGGRKTIWARTGGTADAAAVGPRVLLR